MLLGTFTPKLDEKGRVILPAKFREELAAGVVITRGQENCLYVFSEAEFVKLHERIREVPVTSRQARDYLRVFLSGAHPDTPDKQNRVTLPQVLRDYASLERELTVIGAGSRAEIWNATAWQKYLEEHETGFSQTAEEVIPGLI